MHICAIVIISVFKGHKTTNKQGKKGKKVSLAEEVAFDLALSRASFILDIISHTLVSLSSTDPTNAAQLFFVGFTVLSSFGSGAHPAVQSLALCVLQSRNKDSQNSAGTTSTGSLFGAMALLQSSGQMILGVSDFIKIRDCALIITIFGHSRYFSVLCIAPLLQLSPRQFSHSQLALLSWRSHF